MPVSAERLNRFRATVRPFFQRHWQRALRIRERLRFSEETFHLVLAGGVGLIGGLVNLGFYLAFEFFQLVALGQGGDLLQVAELMRLWQRLVTPALGGLVAGAILFWGLRMVGSQGATHLLEVVVAGNGRLPFRTALVKSISSLVSISTGASIGREGAITQLAATLASKWGQLADWPPYRLRLLVACGAASGIAAAYNAPVAGAVFAAQIVLGNFSMNLFAPLVFSSVVATMVSRSFFGIRSWYNVPPFDFTHITQLPWFVLLAVVAGGLAAGFLKMLRRSEDFFDRLTLPIYGRLMLGGLIVGLISMVFPEVWGNGYSTTNRILHNQYPLGFLIGLFLAKLAATLVSVGSSAVGGIFTPTLFLGAALGSAFVSLLHHTNLATGLPTSAFVLVGMGSLLAGTTHSPLLAMIMIFEISLNYSLMPPLMVACVVSTIVARRFHKESVYTEPLRLETLAAERESMEVGAAMKKTVGDLMRAPVPPVRETTTFRELADRFLTSPNNFFPVVDETGRLIGMVALQDLKEYLNLGDQLRAVIAYDVMRPPPLVLTPNEPVLTALPTLLASEQRNVPVVNSRKSQRLIGSLPRAEVLGLFSEAIAAGRAPKGERA